MRYADDTSLIVTFDQNLQIALGEVAKESKAKGLKLNVKNTENMISSNQTNVPTCNLLRGQPKPKERNSSTWSTWVIQ